MPQQLIAALMLLAAMLLPARPALAQASGSGGPAPDVMGLLPDGRPISVKVRFDLHDINAIDDEAETFEFSGVMTSTWVDPRQAFDPAVEGVTEKIYQGAYQFNEISPAWYPQIMLVNVAGLYDKQGVLLRVRPDGTSTLVETVNAIAEVDLNMRRYPFDRQRLEAVFEVLGFGNDEVVLVPQGDAGDINERGIEIPQWALTGASVHAIDRPAHYAGERRMSSSIVLRLEVHRRSFYVSRLIVIPLVVIVLLSFSVFWMDRSSLGDRVNVSFIGILTGVAYQIVMSQNLPRISYVTLMHGFLNLSFLTMCATVVINLVVGSMDKRGRIATGDRIDRTSRWMFPLVYFGLIGVMLGVAFTTF